MKPKIFYLACALFFTCASSVHASYVLPYPSFMPGNKVYCLSRVADKLKVLWSFGNIAQAKIHMSLSDKYLVEAKTLFEYKQYLLAMDALFRSDTEFSEVAQYIQRGNNERKDMIEIIVGVKEEAVVHKEILLQLQKELPQEVVWRPEKVESTALSIHERIDGAIKIRESVIDIYTNI